VILASLSKNSNHLVSRRQVRISRRRTKQGDGESQLSSLTHLQRRTNMFLKFKIEQIIHSRQLRLIVAMLLPAVVLAGTARADMVTDWNQTAITTLSAAGVRFPPQTRALAMMYAAIFD